MRTIVFGSLLLFVLQACGNASSPEYESGDGTARHVSIAYLKSLCRGVLHPVTEDLWIEGCVVGNDLYGEFPDAHRSESGAQRSAEYLHQAAFSTAIASQQCRCSAGFDGKIYTRKNHPITERQLDRIYFKNMFFRGVHTVQGIRISAAYNTPASLCRNSHPTAYVVEPPDCGNSRTHRYNAV